MLVLSRLLSLERFSDFADDACCRCRAVQQQVRASLKKSSKVVVALALYTALSRLHQSLSSGPAAASLPTSSTVSEPGSGVGL